MEIYGNQTTFNLETVLYKNITENSVGDGMSPNGTALPKLIRLLRLWGRIGRGVDCSNACCCP